MKKVISFLIIISVLLTMCLINTTALQTTLATDPSLIEAQVMSEVKKAFGNLALEYDYPTLMWDYYCHFTDENTIDYVYVNWSSSGGSSAITGDRYLDYCIKCSSVLSPTIGLYIYDVESKKIYTFEEAEVYAVDHLKDFLDNHSDEMIVSYKVYKCGDMDLDNDITILDATMIQRAIAQLEAFPSYNTLYNMYYTHPKEQEVLYVSDVDYDGETSILDATAIQIKLAKID